MRFKITKQLLPVFSTENVFVCISHFYRLSGNIIHTVSKIVLKMMLEVRTGQVSGSEWWLLRGVDEIHFSISGCGIFHYGFFSAMCEVVALVLLRSDLEIFFCL